MRKNKLLRAILSILLCILTLSSIIPFAAIDTFAYSAGDLNNDDKYNAVDAALMTREILGMDVPGLVKQVGDINNDGKVNSVDMSLLKKAILGSYVINSEKYKVTGMTLGGVDISEYSIVLPSEYPSGSYRENAEYAGELLTKYIKEACGIKVNVVESGAGNCITFKYDKALGKDAFKVEVLDGQVEVTCGLARGPMYAAFGILRDIFGYTFYPRDVVVIDELGKVNKEAGYTHTEGLNTPFTTRDAYTLSRLRSKIPDAHSGSYIMSTLAHHNTGMWDGNGWINNPKYGYVAGADRNHSISYFLPGRELSSSGKYCFTNDDNIKLCIENVRKYVDSLINSGYVLGENMPKISIAMADTDEWCSCRNCSKKIREYGTKSSTLVYFLNEVSKQITPDYPGIEFWTLAYVATNKAPEGMKVEPNICFCFAPINHCMNHALFDENCPVNQKDGWGNTKYIETWKKITDNVHVWWYGLLYDMTAYYIPQVNWIYDSVINMAKAGAVGSFFENEETSMGLTDMTSYLVSELTWNPDISKEEYLDMVRKFCVDYYGSEKFYDLIMLLEDCRSDECFYCFTLNSSNWPVFDEKLVSENFDKFYELYDASLAEITDETVKARFVHAASSIQFSVLSEAHTAKYVNGTADVRNAYIERYRELYNYLKKMDGKYYFQFFTYSGAASLPTEFDPSVKPRNWYS